MVRNKMQKMIIITLLVALFGGMCSQTALAAEQKDSLFEMVPEDALFCVRINKFNYSLGMIDQYIAGASPVPMGLTMLAGMQMAGIMGDPMMTGIDKEGYFAIAGMLTEEEDVNFVIFVPITDYKTLLNNPNISEPDAAGISILDAQGSPVGKLAIVQSPSAQYALVGDPDDTDSLVAFKNRLGQSKKSFLFNLNRREELTTATQTPIWGYLNTAKLYDFYQTEVNAGLEEMTTELDEVYQEMSPQLASMMKIYLELFKVIATDASGQTQSVQLALSPKPDVLNLDFMIYPKKGSAYAKMMVIDPKLPKGFSLAGYLEQSAMFSGLFKINKPFADTLSDHLIKQIKTKATDDIDQKTIAELEETITLFSQMMGEEMAQSMSLVKGTPPFSGIQVYKTTQPFAMRKVLKNYAELMKKYMSQLGSLDESAMTMKFDYKENVSTFNGAQVDEASFRFSFPESDDELMQAQKAMFDTMYGKDGFTYHIAHKGKMSYVAFSPDSMASLEALLQKQPTTANKNIQTALSVIPNADTADMVASFNIIKYLQGVGEMMDTVGQTVPNGQAMPPQATAIFKAFNVPTNSAMALGMRFADNHATFNLALPKEHLIEIVTAVMQVQQQMMQAQMQACMPDDDMQGMSGMQPNQMQGLPPQNPGMGQFENQPTPSDINIDSSMPRTMQSLIGKPATDLTMIDLNNNKFSLSSLRGRPVILDFWATWCPPCKEQIPHLIELRNKYTNKQLAIIGISNEPFDRLRTFIKNNQTINYPIVPYNETLKGTYADIQAIPTMYIIDAKGIIRNILVGYHPIEELEANLQAIK